MGENTIPQQVTNFDWNQAFQKQPDATVSKIYPNRVPLTFGNGFQIEKFPRGEGLMTPNGGFVFTEFLWGLTDKVSDGWHQVYKPHFLPTIDGIELGDSIQAETPLQKLQTKLAAVDGILTFIEAFENNQVAQKDQKLSFSSDQNNGGLNLDFIILIKPHETTLGFFNLLRFKLGFRYYEVEKNVFVYTKASDLAEQKPSLKDYKQELVRKIEVINSSKNSI